MNGWKAVKTLGGELVWAGQEFQPWLQADGWWLLAPVVEEATT
jgi:hypothetical protein